MDDDIQEVSPTNGTGDQKRRAEEEGLPAAKKARSFVTSFRLSALDDE